MLSLLISYKLWSSRQGYNERMDNILLFIARLSITSGLTIALLATAICIFTFVAGDATYAGVALIMMLPRVAACNVRPVCYAFEGRSRPDAHRCSSL